MDIRIYTDGACSKNGYDGAIAGWGYVVVLVNGELCKAVHSDKGAIPDGTNNVGELTAIKNAIIYTLNLRRNMPEEPLSVEIYSDSAYCINGINDWRFKWKRFGWWRNQQKTQPVRNKELWQEIDAMIDSQYMKFLKCEGHAGIKYNEYADELATSAVKEYKENGTV